MQQSAGKTTLFSLITRLYDSHTGAIKINGFDIKKQTRRALAQLGVVFQQPTLDLDLSVIQNLKYHASLHGLSPKFPSMQDNQTVFFLNLVDKMSCP